jgi:hypothetical protein
MNARGMTRSSIVYRIPCRVVAILRTKPDSFVYSEANIRAQVTLPFWVESSYCLIVIIMMTTWKKIQCARYSLPTQGNRPLAGASYVTPHCPVVAITDLRINSMFVFWWEPSDCREYLDDRFFGLSLNLFLGIRCVSPPTCNLFRTARTPRLSASSQPHEM